MSGQNGVAPARLKNDCTPLLLDRELSPLNKFRQNFVWSIIFMLFEIF